MKKIINSAEILCVGTELLLGEVVNTNAAFIAKELADLGISVYHQSVVGDNPERLARELRTALKRSDLVVMTGGLGPTCDDLTKETAASVFGLDLVVDEYSLGEIHKYFEKVNRIMPINNEKQALVPRGCTVLRNDWGTAPGMAITGEEGSEFEGKTAILMPGVPREMKFMFINRVRPYLKERCPFTMVSRNLHIIGMGESAVETVLRKLMDESENPTLAPYAKDGETRLRVTAKAKTQEEGLAMCDSLIEKVMATEVGQFVFGIDVETIENAVLMALRADGETLATAESCTGGLISKRLTDISGASDVYLGGAVTYANEAKVKILGVSEDDLKTYGAVSEPVARQMAEGVRALLGADFGISVTGIAGPTGGSEEKPVGTVFVGLASKNGTTVRKLSLSSMRDREYVRTVAATGALAMILDEKKVK